VPIVLAVDIGGTKLAAALVDVSTAAILHRDRAATDRADPWQALVGLLGATLAAARAGGLAPVAVGVGCGGPMEPGGRTVSPLNIVAWRGFPLRSRLEDLTALPVAIDNDAKALALAEGWCGAAAGVSDYLAMVVSTGVGGGIVLGGELLDGASGNAGHVGHVVVEPGGRACACGGSGCLEAEVSGTAIAAVTGRPAAEASLLIRERCGRLTGRAVASVAALLDLRLAVVAGSVALGYGSTFFESAQRELDRACRIEYARGITIVPAGLGSDGPLVGAAAVARRILALP
jgi:glucokinase